MDARTVATDARLIASRQPVSEHLRFGHFATTYGILRRSHNARRPTAMGPLPPYAASCVILDLLGTSRLGSGICPTTTTYDWFVGRGRNTNLTVVASLVNLDLAICAALSLHSQCAPESLEPNPSHGSIKLPGSRHAALVHDVF